MTVPDLDSREKIDTLLVAFYERALDDELLGPVFRAARMDLATHLPRIAVFWEKTLLGSGSYDGRPMRIHQHLMETAGLRGEHFERWLELWQRTTREGFAGPLAEQAVTDAVRIAEAMLGRQPAAQDLPLTSRPAAT
jgi:hemoglobin